ncbi:protein SUPPRESSOR OF QUENCHING 1, chloroplastic isoform X2 [Selaginella moellendorffii]|uniref:protein SUPPRESSOR OF QUENCHING 1, chloroplastic isoform X2 n=1 Tax=Selaginella moellendorffii TaxID=88036 RepID=UPI000D1CF583|nr:protein SUPPRESSOR OF QUENCHING 1, chloroplastic isoform X2 [Selaginella moellendorffii]|eukprot:XP_024522693.1 protein SUPPRESSOR OF QUENCHING 1, chloroplastic isoform X2 [Selaginella moellendorffii]
MRIFFTCLGISEIYSLELHTCAMAMAPSVALTPYLVPWPRRHCGAGDFRPALAFAPEIRGRRDASRRWRGSNGGNRSCSCARAVEKSRQGAVLQEEAPPVRGVLFDMDGVLCDSEERSRDAAVDVFAGMGVTVRPEDFIPFMGTGEANFLGGVAGLYQVPGFDPIQAKEKFFEVYIQKYAKPDSGLGYPGALELIMECKRAGLKVAVASSADRIKVDANLSAAGLPQTNFDAIVSADVFERLKPAPDIFLAAAKALGLPPSECVVVEDALAGVQAARAAGMRCIAVSTTLSEESLAKANPTLTRMNIANITLSDILNLQDKDVKEAAPGVTGMDWIYSILDTEVSLPFGTSITRRDIIRLGSFSLGTSCLAFAATRWKAMTYGSPMALLNAFLGADDIPLAIGSELDSGNRIDSFKSYISNLEAKSGGQKVMEFPPGLQWLNTAAPLRFKGALHGKVVILDFWTYCCINCMHVLPDLAYLEQKYKDQPLTVVGVHSAKFDNEKDTEAIRNAVLRYNVTHPVVNDGDMNLWRKLGVSSWPTFVVVSPNGKVIARLAGEGHRKDLDNLVDAALQYYGEKKLLNAQPIPLQLEKSKSARILTTPLSFPGKLATDLANGRLFISDSNHNRIVVTDLNGNYILQVGSGSEGLTDGSFSLASFNRPQGVAYDTEKNILYVADTENHALREVDFVKETVRTLAGTGERGFDYRGGKAGQSQPLNSPWDLCLHPDGMLYIAMAGEHQIWEFNRSNGVAKVFSGDGYERNLNGSKGSNSSYAQPSGLSLSPDMDHLYIADSESSSVRSVNLKTGGSQWLSGGDPTFPENLFQFGDKDGPASQALFQHPLGILSSANGAIYVADSYNHKIKLMDLASKTVRTVAGTGVAGYEDGKSVKAQFSEPAGLALGPNGSLFVADTNNNLIRLLKPGADDNAIQVTTLELKGVEPPRPLEKSPRRLRRRPSSDMEVVRLQAVPGLRGDLQLQIDLPPEYHFSKEATSKYEVDVEPDDSVDVKPDKGTFQDGRASLSFERSKPTSSLLRIISKVYYCEEEKVCLYKGIVVEVPLEESNGGTENSSSIPVKLTVTPPQQQP